MNNEILKNIDNLKNDLLSEPLILEYLKLRNIKNSSKKLTNLEKKIHKIKKCNMSDKEISKLNKLIAEYNSSELVKQYNNVSDDVICLLEEIKEELEN